MELSKLEKRMYDLGFTESKIEFIFSDWPNWEEHLAWLETATKEEITSWGESVNWGEEQ